MQLPAGTDVCPDCGYSMVGHAQPMRCPECGCEDVGAAAIVLWGDGQVLNVHTAAARIRPAGTMNWGALAAAVSLVLLGVTGLAAGIPVAVVLLGFGLLSLAIVILRRLERAPLARRQLRITPGGFGLRRGTGRVEHHPWKRGDCILILFTPPDRLAVQIVRRSFSPPAIVTEGSADDAATVLRRTSEWIIDASADAPADAARLD